jgi:type VI protein secretion system component Hcp
MPTDIFMKIRDIQGESRDKDHAAGPELAKRSSRISASPTWSTRPHRT